MSILITPPNKKAIRLDRKRFSQEVDLQKYIYDNPDAIPLQEIKEDAQILILERESPTPAGPIDILVVDNEGELYLIETKLYKNPDKRQVLAQVLDYGAALWGGINDPDEWLQSLDRRRINAKQPGLVDTFENEFGHSQPVLDGIKSCLQNGSFQFLILMDEVHSPLKNLILYMNENSRFSVYAVEMEYYEHDGYQILIPHLFGAESQRKASSVSESGRRKWDEASFFEDAEQKLNKKEVDAIRRLYQALIDLADIIVWGTGKSKGSFNPKINTISTRSLLNIFSDGSLTMSYYWLDDDEYAVRCGEVLKEKLSSIPPLKNEIESSGHKYPSVSHQLWIPYTDDLINVFSEFVDECQRLKEKMDK
ncbi:MAG: hypothetical protein WBB69_06765 [Anaerolineales bacterium]